MAEGVYRLGSRTPLPPHLDALPLQAAGELLLPLDHRQGLEADRQVEVQPAGVDSPAGDVQLLGEVAAAQGLPLGVQVQHPDVAHALAAEGVLADAVGGELRHHPAFQHLLDVWAIVWKVVLGIYGHFKGAVEHGVECVV